MVIVSYVTYILTLTLQVCIWVWEGGRGVHRSPERVLLSGRGQAARHRLRAPEARAVRELAS